MGHTTCCVVNCKNNGVNSKCVFYSFPTAKHRIDQRNKWIIAVKRINPNGLPWNPKRSDYICSAHFIGNQRSNDPLSPSYVPKIFPSAYKVEAVNEKSSIARHSRFMERRKKKVLPLSSTVETDQLTIKTEQEQLLMTAITQTELQMTDDPVNFKTVQKNSLKYADKECQVQIYIDSMKPENTFTCNRYINNTPHNDVEIQTDITEDGRVIIVPSQQKFKDEKCGLAQKIYVDQSVGPNTEDKVTATSNFAGFSSVKKDQQLLDLAGVTFANFNFLLKRLSKNPADYSKISKEDRLFIFLVKIKTGLTFSTLSVLFSVHRVTISRIFFSTLQDLTSATANLVFWPEKDVVQGTMPQCFYPNYSDTRVIIDCTEFRIKVPATVDARVFTYSHYKKDLTAKVLIGITPGGFISFKSKVAGGRKSDSQITIESGLIDLLEDGDTVLADKGFPDVQRTMDATGKQMVLVVPPFLRKKTQFDKKETEATYNIAKVRIHVERIMQRLRTHQILNKIPATLFHCIDDILHVCCVLVNLQSPIISETTDIVE